MVGLRPTPRLDLGTDNSPRLVIDLSYNPEHHQCVKHIERRHFFIRVCVENMQINVPFVRITGLICSRSPCVLACSFVPLRNVIMNVRVPDASMNGGALASATSASATGGS